MGNQSQLQIDSTHCRAICEEIGWRLHAILARETPALPPRLQLLMDRLAEQDREMSPSIVPSMHDMVWPAAPVADPIGLTRAA